MKANLIIASLILLCHLNLFSQVVSPGGVPEYFLWGQSDQIDNQAVFKLKSIDGEEVIDCGHLVPSLYNFNPAIKFKNGNDGISISIGEQDLSKLTVFTVFHTNDSTYEQSVWHFTKGIGINLLLTSHRMADLMDYHFMNFIDSKNILSRVNTYNQFKIRDTSSYQEQRLTFGIKPESENIPILSLNGLLAEIVIYPRVLSPEEQAKVESYLSLKYGVSLSKNIGSNYYNSNSEIIFNNKMQYPFIANITGIGKDNTSGLDQKQSKNSSDPRLFSLGIGSIEKTNALNLSELEENSFLIWSDNNAHFSLEQKEQGKPQFIKRKWIMNTFGAVRHLSTELNFDVRRTAIDLDNSDTWWLAIDRSSNGNFSSENTEYFPVDYIKESGIAVFEDIFWDNDFSKKDLFTLGIGPKLLPVYSIHPPTCFPEIDGQISVRAIGGQPPYSFELKSKENNYEFSWNATSEESKNVEGIKQGEYLLRVVDANSEVTLESFYIQSSDAPSISLNTQYSLDVGEALLLDASPINYSSDIYYIWEGPNGFYSSDAQVSISSAGTYSVYVDYNGCISRKDIVVSNFQTTKFKKVEIYPNPTSGGVFKLSIYLHDFGDVFIRIFDVNGKTLLTKTLDGKDYYKEKFELPIPSGIYFVNLTADDESSETLKLIVE